MDGRNVVMDGAVMPAEFNRGHMCLPAGKEMDDLVHHVLLSGGPAGVDDATAGGGDRCLRFGDFWGRPSSIRRWLMLRTRCAGLSTASPDDGVDAALRCRIKIDGRIAVVEKDDGGMPIGAGEDDVRPVRERLQSTLHAVAIVDGLRSQRICNHVVVAKLMSGSDRADECSLMDGEDDVNAGWNSPDLKKMTAAVLLAGSNHPIRRPSKGRWTAAMAAVPVGDDGALY
ncbi:hypothetical protein ACLOJK_040200 [Asimina triloba]